MSDRLKTVAEWERMGFHVMEHEHSEHKNKWGEYLFRPDQVEEDYIEEFDEETDFPDFEMDSMEADAWGS